MEKKRTVEDFERAAAFDRAEILSRVDQRLKKSNKEQVLQQLKQRLESGHRVQIKHEDLKFKDHIGHGASGSIYEAVWLGHPFAVKVFQTGDCTFPRELEVLSSLKHPNILHIAGHSYRPSRDEHMLLMEKMDMDLATFLKRSEAPLNTANLLSVTLQIAMAMKCLHSRQIIHRDLKPQNVLVRLRGGHIDVQVADFGLARTGFMTSLLSAATSKRGTRQYMAPEVWTSEKYSKKADVYSFGMLCYQLVTMKIPYHDTENFMDMVQNGYRPDLPDTMFTKLITQCWEHDPGVRPDFSQVCQTLVSIKAAWSTRLEDIVMAEEQFLAFVRGPEPSPSSKAESLMDVNETHWTTETFTEVEIIRICLSAKKIFYSEPSLLELEAPIIICGDIHGQFEDLLRHFEGGGFPHKTKYLFLGNYVGYGGQQNLETICHLLVYKVKYPNNIFLLRGSHESATSIHKCGFDDECNRRFNLRLGKVFTKCFNYLPIAAVISNKIFCAHRGLSPELTHLNQIRNLARPLEVLDSGLLCDLLCSRPGVVIDGVWGNVLVDELELGSGVDGWRNVLVEDKLGFDDDRKSTITLGKDVVKAFLNEQNFDLICRSGEMVKDGYKYFADRGCVTIFSALNYLGIYNNAGAVMKVDKDLVCSFQILQPEPISPLRFRGGKAALCMKLFDTALALALS